MHSITKRLNNCALELKNIHDIIRSVHDELLHLSKVSAIVDAELLESSEIVKMKCKWLYHDLLEAAEFQQSADESSELEKIVDEEEKMQIREVLARKDQALNSLYQHLLLQCLDLREKLISESASADIPMEDFKIETNLTFFIDPSDSEYSDDSDNILTERNDIVSLSWVSRGGHIDIERERTSGNFLDYTSDFMKTQCWLTHDVMKHSYGAPNQQAIGVDGMLRVNEVWVDVIVTRQYLYDLSKGEFIQSPR
jgi:hypothetical protein